MFDLQVLALQGDVTRVIDFQLARETSNRAYPEIGVAEGHHPLTHNGGNPEMLAKCAKINAFHVSLFAYYLEKLKATPDGDGTLLDHSALSDGSGMSNADKHDHVNLPIIVAGGRHKTGGRHIRSTPNRRRWQISPDAAGPGRRARWIRSPTAPARVQELVEPLTL